MIGSEERKRVRPSLKSLGLSAVVGPALLIVEWLFFGSLFYAPVLASLVAAFAVSLFRIRGLRLSLPEPYGSGRTSTIDAGTSARAGYLIILAGVFFMIVFIGGFYFFPSAYLAFFVLAFGLMAGLPLNEIVFFAVVTRLEAKSRSRIFSVTEEASEGGKLFLVRTVELAPRSSSD